MAVVPLVVNHFDFGATMVKGLTANIRLGDKGLGEVFNSQYMWNFASF
jgi:hypothetical protein